ncbi:hypothetical protein WJX73_007516 [Symbiochloris irregularis]|uniref:Pentatricopeptide repeat-containing protein n=1 Tax=Symbiochloris irregularis TaxID=706552 RepID=A0AAW1Q204_9CHLO
MLATTLAALTERWEIPDTLRSRHKGFIRGELCDRGASYLEPTGSMQEPDWGGGAGSQAADAVANNLAYLSVYNGPQPPAPHLDPYRGSGRPEANGCRMLMGFRLLSAGEARPFQNLLASASPGLAGAAERTLSLPEAGAEGLGALYHFDSRAAALLLKDLSKVGLGHRAVELFDWLRKLTEAQPLHALCDVYTYTAMISMCIYQQDVARAMELAHEMRARNIERNVHTYTALMNVCIKCGKCPLALDTYHHMRQDGCLPNVVTYNTLIDVYGKMGQWDHAVKVLSTMKAEGVEPVLRTYNTLIIACNMCNQPREAMAVHKRMLDEGYTPNATTYNALISAHGKAGQLDKVMEVFQEMVWKGCERSVITYSSLISACEKAGQWELALELFNEMHSEGCLPNTVTFNSLITACAQGVQWQKAAEVFEEMKGQGCTPDVVTYTALISAYEKGGQWRLALGAFDTMRAQRCKPDAIVYNAITDALWETGVIWAQRRALGLFQRAVEEGHFKQQRWDTSAPWPARAEVNLHAMTAGVAVLSLYTWLVSLKQRLLARGAGSLPARLAIVSDKGKSSKEAGNLVVKEAVAAMMAQWDSPFRASTDNVYSGMLEASGEAVEEWLQSPGFEEQLFCFFPCTDVMPSLANKGLMQDSTAAQHSSAALDDEDFAKEVAVEVRCAEAFAAVQHFEKTHCLALQNMSFAYLQRRTDLVNTALAYARRLNLKDEVAHDAMLLMDRTMSTSLQVKDELLNLLAAACVIIAGKQGERPNNTPTDAELEAAIGMQAGVVTQMEWQMRRVLGNDTSAISTLRCLKLYLERLGCNFLDQESVQMLAGSAFSLVRDSISDMAFLNCRPSVIAAAIIYAERRARGIIPFWPSMLSKLTHYQDMSTPELSVAIKAAQVLVMRPPRSPTSQGVSSPTTPLQQGAPSSPATPHTPHHSSHPSS